MHFLKNVAGGNRSKRLNPDNSIDRFFNKDRRADNLRFVTMQVMTLSPHSLAANHYVWAFLAPITKYVPLSHDTVVEMLLEIDTHLINCVRTKFQAAKKRMRGIPFTHIVTDLWTDKHNTKSYASVLVRYVDPADGFACRRLSTCWKTRPCKHCALPLRPARVLFAGHVGRLLNDHGLWVQRAEGLRR